MSDPDRTKPGLDALWALMDRHVPTAMREAGGVELLRARMLLLVCGVFAVASIPAFISRALIGVRWSEVALVSGAVVVGSLAPWMLRRTGRTAPLSVVVLISGVALAVLGALGRDGLLSATIVWIVLLPPMSAFLFGPGATAWSTAIVGVIVAGVAGVHLAGLLPLGPRGELAHRAVNLSAMTLVTASIVRLYAWSEDRARAAEREALRMMEAASTAVGVGTALLADGRVRQANVVAEALLGRPHGGLVGAAAADLLPPGVAAELRPGAPPMEIDLPAPQGLRRVELRVSAVDAPGGETALVTLVDLTERWRAEQERLRLHARLLETERLESLGRIAGGVAHDFNNILTGILGNVQVLEDVRGLGAEERQAVGDVRVASERAASLVAQLLAYAGRGHAVLRRVDAAAVAREAVRLAEAARRTPKVVAFEVEGPAVAWADESLISQVCTNLLTNALDAVAPAVLRPGAVRVRVATATVDVAVLAQDRLPPPSPAPGRFVRIEVRDEGCGIAPELRARLFEPFYSAKPTGRGLGLAAVQGILRRLGGALLLESEPGRGSTFAALIPAASATAPTPDEGVARESVPTPSAAAARALVVEDDPIVRTQIARILRRAGMEVVAVDDGFEALAAVESAVGAFDVAVLDYLMPGLDGVETARRLRSMDPSLPMVLCSGTVGSADVGAVGFAAIVPKPFSPNALVSAVVSAARAR